MGLTCSSQSARCTVMRSLNCCSDSGMRSPPTSGRAWDAQAWAVRVLAKCFGSNTEYVHQGQQQRSVVLAKHPPQVLFVHSALFLQTATSWTAQGTQACI